MRTTFILSVVSFSLVSIHCGSSAPGDSPGATGDAISAGAATPARGVMPTKSSAPTAAAASTSGVCGGYENCVRHDNNGNCTAQGFPNVQGSQSVGNLTIYNIGWGNVAAGGTANADTGFLASSSFLSNLGEYGINGASFGFGVASGETPPRTVLSDGDVQSFVQRMISRGKVPGGNGSNLYVVYLQQGYIVQGGCTSMCGYHGHVGNDLYAVIIDPASCSSGSCGTEADREMTASHEIAEAASDPYGGGSGHWSYNSGEEIGDICAWQGYWVDGYKLQCIWSQRAGKCVATVEPGADGIGVAAGNCTANEYNAQNLNGASYWTCQGSSRYVCDGQGHKVTETCNYGWCNSQGAGQDDQCPYGGGVQCTAAEYQAQLLGNASYWTCQGNSRYVCDGSNWKVTESCPRGCTPMGAGVDDQCN